jgi:hypothetical protein
VGVTSFTETAALSWWINPMFALRDGIIDRYCVNGGICYNRALSGEQKRSAYAVVLRGSDEIGGESPYRFTYRCHQNDRGMFRLTSKRHTCERCLVRVLRTHSLSSLNAPVAGIRYDGL